MHSGSRLVDELRAEAASRGLALPEAREVGAFADLDWTPGESTVEAIVERSGRDPDFSMDGFTRWVVFGRVSGQIRYYAAPIPEGAPDWWWSSEGVARVAATLAEPDEYELGALSSVADAVTLAFEYLGGRPFAEIRVPRTLHGWESAAG
jgi:hypothetical protein